MTSLREQIAQRKQAKKFAQQLKAEKIRIEAAKHKRDRDIKIDNIPFYEWTGSPYYTYFNLMKAKIASNNLVVNDLLQHFIQLHRFTFWECDYDFSNIRVIIENLFDKYISEFDLSNVEQIINKTVSIHYKQRDLLLQFMDMLPSLVFSHTSRKEFALANSEMIIGHNVWCNATKPHLAKFVDWAGVEEAQELLRLKINSKMLYQAAINKKVLVYTDTGDFEELSA